MYTDLNNLCVIEGTSIRDAIARMDVSRVGIVLVVDSERRLLGTITDGDVRRAVLAHTDLGQPAELLLADKAGSRFAEPISVPAAADRDAMLQVLQQNSIRHLPLVDDDQHVVAMVTLDDFVPEQDTTVQALIVAGGLGVRLRPLTEDMPKPMLPVGDRPLMEIIVQQLQQAGVKHVNVAVHHKSEKITEHFGDGHRFGVDISYLTEERPLGTAGALGLMDAPQGTVLVINGDILTQVDFRAMLAYHREHLADLTVAVQQYDVQVPYGVIECDDISVRRLVEKPTLSFFVNAGIYLLEPSAYGFVPAGERCEMTDLIQRLSEEGRSVVAFPIREYWMDIGQHAEYEQAQQDIRGWQHTP